MVQPIAPVEHEIVLIVVVRIGEMVGLVVLVMLIALLALATTREKFAMVPVLTA